MATWPLIDCLSDASLQELAAIAKRHRYRLPERRQHGGVWCMESLGQIDKLMRQIPPAPDSRVLKDF